MAVVALVPAAIEAAKNQGIRDAARQGHNLGFGIVKTLLLMPVIIVGIIILFGALIAVGNGAYTMGTFIAFLIGAAMFAGPIWLIKSAGSMSLEGPPPPQYDQMYAQPNYGYPPYGYPPQQPSGYPPYQQPYQQPQYQQQPYQNMQNMRSPQMQRRAPPPLPPRR